MRIVPLQKDRLVVFRPDDRILPEPIVLVDNGATLCVSPFNPAPIRFDCDSRLIESVLVKNIDIIKNLYGELYDLFFDRLLIKKPCWDEFLNLFHSLNTNSTYCLNTSQDTFINNIDELKNTINNRETRLPITVNVFSETNDKEIDDFLLAVERLGECACTITYNWNLSDFVSVKKIVPLLEHQKVNINFSLQLADLDSTTLDRIVENDEDGASSILNCWFLDNNTDKAFENLENIAETCSGTRFSFSHLQNQYISQQTFLTFLKYVYSMPVFAPTNWIELGDVVNCFSNQYKFFSMLNFLSRATNDAAHNLGSSNGNAWQVLFLMNGDANVKSCFNREEFSSKYYLPYLYLFCQILIDSVESDSCNGDGRSFSNPPNGTALTEQTFPLC